MAMKKRRIQGLGLLAVCLLLMAGPALAVMRNTVFLQETGNGAIVSVRLEERQDDILSLGLSLQISFTDGDGSQAGVSFAFDSAIRSKIMEYRYNEAKGTLSLYISGQENLFADQELTLGTVTVNIADGSSVTARISVIEDSLQVINAAYDNENNEGVSAPEAPEFTVGGETPGEEETVPPPETGGQDPGSNESNPGNNGENPGGSSPNPGNNGQNPGGSSQNPGSSAQNPAGGENPEEEEPAESAAQTEKPTRETTAAFESTENAAVQSTAGAKEPEGTQDSEEQPTQEQSSAAAATDGNQGWEIGIPGEEGIWQVILFGGLGIVGIAGLLALAVWADHNHRARRRRLRHRKLQNGQETAKHHGEAGADPKVLAAREAAKHRRETIARQETAGHHRDAVARQDAASHRRETIARQESAGRRRDAAASQESASHRREVIARQESAGHHRDAVKHRRPVSGPEAAERRAAAREAARMHMEQHKREAADAQSSRRKAGEQEPHRKS